MLGTKNKKKWVAKCLQINRKKLDPLLTVDLYMTDALFRRLNFLFLNKWW